MNDKQSICIAQIGYDDSDVQGHIARIKSIIEDNRDADLIVFPELILHGHPKRSEEPEGFLFRKAKALFGRVSADLYRFIREQRARVIIGEMKEHFDELQNSATYVDGDGEQMYLKTHVHWTENFVPGEALTCYETPLGRVGINICFDAAFSEVWRVLALMGPRLVVNISAVPIHFPVAYMHRRMQGAALDNQVFVVYANRPGPKFGGGSAVFDPRGEFVVSSGTDDVILRVEIDLAEVDRWREEEAVYVHRRPELYRSIGSTAAPARSRQELEEVG
jgi:predicted amidohydrolase